jgi:hypothetical protein
MFDSTTGTWVYTRDSLDKASVVRVRPAVRAAFRDWCASNENDGKSTPLLPQPACVVRLTLA